ncbi:hypothetical protein [Halalkalibacter alkaliphilus]|uniref:Uncharacterized protein n=1 Tax=Halalkalibacter alkaliphilus TaxID=2917993 RepID=A0A9X2CSX1_9BACI|nr:hypothetical protein [Halalkalibacter alkaliphilus]MCL7747701.1 hypothetical protein [Halalkalibacter alkaliphilus]
MEAILDRVFGFLPQRIILWVGVGTLVFILAFQYIYSKLTEILKLPWMKEENQQQRKQILQKNNKNSKQN